MPPDAKKAIDLLNETRQNVGIPQMNKFIFARLTSDNPMSGNTEFKEVVQSCDGLQSPEKITSTNLRKYIATVSQVITEFM